MKKNIILILLLSFILPTTVYAADMGVQIIESPEETSIVPVSLDDIQLMKDITIDDYAVITPTKFEYSDTINMYYEGGGNTIYSNSDEHLSGNEAKYALLSIDITNLAQMPVNFLSTCAVKIVYDDKYEYSGWSYQLDYDHKDYWGLDKDRFSKVLHPSDVVPIDSLYIGHYVFGCTLPNSVIESKKALRMEINMDGNEIIYNIRK